MGFKGLFPNANHMATRMFYQPNGQIFVSILFGLALAMVFQRVCKDKKCIIITAPSIKEITGKVYQFEGECYKYKPYGSKCPDDETEIVKSV
jgi:hypothetical protein